MKDLFKSRFPYVTMDDSELNKEELKIKKQYENQYISKKNEVNQLREVHIDDKRARRKSKR